MTVSTVTSKIVYVGDETTTTFAYPFKVLAEDDLAITRYYVATRSTDILVLNSNYEVTGVGDAAGGTVTLTGSVAEVSAGSHYVHSGCQLVIQRVVPLTQETDYVANDSFPAETHEEALDRVTMITQQLQEQVDRCIKADINQTTSGMTYTEIADAAAAATGSSAAVCVSASAGTVANAVLTAADRVATAADAILCSGYVASVTSGPTAALDNLTATSINESLVPGSSNYINLGSATKSWANVYIWNTAHITTVRSILLSSATMNVSGTADAVTLRATMVTSTSLRVSGTANITTLGDTTTAVTLRATLVTANTLNISGTADAVTLRVTLLTATSLRVSGTGAFSNISGDGSLLTGIANITAVTDVETTGVLVEQTEATILSAAKTITAGRTVFAIASGYFYSDAQNITLKLKYGTTVVQTKVIAHIDSNGTDWSSVAMITSLSGAVTFSITGEGDGGVSDDSYAKGNLIVVEF